MVKKQETKLEIKSRNPLVDEKIEHIQRTIEDKNPNVEDNRVNVIMILLADKNRETIITEAQISEIYSMLCWVFGKDWDAEINQQLDELPKK